MSFPHDRTDFLKAMDQTNVTTHKNIESSHTILKEMVGSDTLEPLPQDKGGMSVNLQQLSQMFTVLAEHVQKQDKTIKHQAAQIKALTKKP